MAKINKSKELQENFRSKWGTSPSRMYTKDIEKLLTKLSNDVFLMRQEQNLTQEDVSSVSGVSQGIIARMESEGYDGRSIAALVKVATALGKKVTIDIKDRK